MLSILKKLFTQSDEAVATLEVEDAIIVDVRTNMEFAGGHLEDSVNIPLDKIQNHINEFKKSAKPVVLVCRSGARSGRAAKLLRSHGIDAYNGGSWSSFRA
jgi:rhodanese-related sulfurtransferase